MGYDNYIQLGYYRMNRNSYDRNDVENFRRQVKGSIRTVCGARTRDQKKAPRSGEAFLYR